MTKIIRLALVFNFCICCLFFQVQGQTMAELGFPFVQNYPKSVYKSGNKNWSVTQDENGIMYFGNNNGLLAFDGEHWQHHKMPQRIVPRAVAADGKGRVYVGGFAEFGYWAYNTKGIFTYTSLAALVPESATLRNDIWKIYVEGNKVYFQSFAAIYVYENDTIKVVRGNKEPFLFLLKSNGRYFIEGVNKGLYELRKDSLHFIPSSTALGNSGVLAMLPFPGNKYLIGTAKNGLFLFDGKEMKPWANEANAFLKQYQLNNGVLVQGKYFVFGTILNGVVVLDEQGRLVQHVNKPRGLQNNTVLNLFADKEQNLWVGLDNGIDRIEVNSPLFYFFDKTGKFGTVYTSIIHGDRIYLGTNQGLFYSEWSDKKNLSLQAFDFKIIEDSQGQVWNLSLVGDQLLCGHNEGTFLVEGTKIRKISDVKGGWVVKRLNSHPDLLIQGTYTGLVAYKKDENGSWVFSHQLNGFNVPSRYIEEDNAGHIWVSHDYRGLYKLALSSDLKSVESARRYSQSDGLPGDINIFVFKLENRNVFSSDSGFYMYDEISDKFLRYKELNQKLNSFASASRVIKATGKKYWLIENGKVALANFSSPGKVKIETSQFSRLSGHMVQFYENINRISDALYLISIDDGFVVYNEALQQQKAVKLPPVNIRRVHNITNNLKVLTENGTSLDKLEIPYKSNNLRISFALPHFSPVKTKYQYYLEGYSSSWSDWSSVSSNDFTNLDWGTYRFQVRAKVGEDAQSPVTVYEFTVLPPWYATTWAYLLYGLLVLVLLLLFRYLYKLKLRQDQRRMQIKLEREKEEFLKQETIANEQRIIKLKNEQLEAELASKSRELANSAMNIISKNELLQSLKSELAKLKDPAGKKLSGSHLQKVHRIIDDGMNSERDWNMFGNSFDEAHENYFKKLKALYPELTPNDLKFCAFLRMNMSSKEIAALLNITVRGVEIRRYRLRKKLNLEHEKNLVEFLMEV